mmetsp:Transcript_1162/g.2436  ORF Transcript_1162/g.2436 Transcript_1162/m.2436 type:complete len:587 (-) Transcript_1162:113-1873(-)
MVKYPMPRKRCDSTPTVFHTEPRSKEQSSDPRATSAAGGRDEDDLIMPVRTTLGVRRNSRERSMSRRERRNSVSGKYPSQMCLTNNGVICNGSNLGYMHQMRANVSRYNSLPEDSMTIEDSLSSVVLKSLSKKSLCDVKIVGKDDVPVEAPSYLLSAHSEVFESLFYSESTKIAEDEKPSDSIGGNKSSRPHRVELEFAEWDAIEATMHFLATRSLPLDLENGANESNIRYICQIHLFGRLFKIPSLTNHAYRTARRLMNKTPRLVCAAFDECSVSKKLLPPRYSLPSSHDELEAYVLAYLRDSPLTTLLAGGTVFLSDASMEAIICDQDMDVDEHTMFCILNTWVNHDKDHNIEKGRALVSNINLSYIKTDYLNNVVKKCGFVQLSDVEAALKDIEEMLANQSPDEKEHVLVEGAGKDEINGIYVRMNEDIGLGEEEVVFVKEAQEDEYCPDYGLYLLGSTWAITSCVDYSNILYSFESSEGPASTHCQPPKSGWKTVVGKQPSPICTWSPSKDNEKSTGKGYVAPDLAAGGTNHNNLDDIANGDHDDGQIRLSLRMMLNLPSDEGHKENDYHDDNDDSNTDKDI